LVLAALLMSCNFTIPVLPLETDHEAQLYQLKQLIQQLPEVNRETLKRIILHLRRWVGIMGPGPWAVAGLVWE